MYRTAASVDGMMCGMCEVHVTDAVKKAFPEAQSVKSSRRTKQTVIISAAPIDEDALRRAIEATGYDVGTICCAPCEKKLGFLSRLFGRQ